MLFLYILFILFQYSVTELSGEIVYNGFARMTQIHFATDYVNTSIPFATPLYDTKHHWMCSSPPIQLPKHTNFQTIVSSLYRPLPTQKVSTTSIGTIPIYNSKLQCYSTDSKTCIPTVFPDLCESPFELDLNSLPFQFLNLENSLFSTSREISALFIQLNSSFPVTQQLTTPERKLIISTAASKLLGIWAWLSPIFSSTQWVDPINSTFVPLTTSPSWSSPLSIEYSELKPRLELEFGPMNDYVENFLNFLNFTQFENLDIISSTLTSTTTSIPLWDITQMINSFQNMSSHIATHISSSNTMSLTLFEEMLFYTRLTTHALWAASIRAVSASLYEDNGLDSLDNNWKSWTTILTTASPSDDPIFFSNPNYCFTNPTSLLFSIKSYSQLLSTMWLREHPAATASYPVTDFEIHSILNGNYSSTIINTTGIFPVTNISRTSSLTECTIRAFSSWSRILQLDLTHTLPSYPYPFILPLDNCLIWTQHLNPNLSGGIFPHHLESFDFSLEKLSTNSSFSTSVGQNIVVSIHNDYLPKFNPGFVPLDNQTLSPSRPIHSSFDMNTLDINYPELQNTFFSFSNTPPLTTHAVKSPELTNHSATLSALALSAIGDTVCPPGYLDPPGCSTPCPTGYYCDGTGESYICENKPIDSVYIDTAVSDSNCPFRCLSAPYYSAWPFENICKLPPLGFYSLNGNITLYVCSSSLQNPLNHPILPASNWSDSCEFGPYYAAYAAYPLDTLNLVYDKSSRALLGSLDNSGSNLSGSNISSEYYNCSLLTNSPDLSISLSVIFHVDTILEYPYRGSILNCWSDNVILQESTSNETLYSYVSSPNFHIWVFCTNSTSCSFNIGSENSPPSSGSGSGSEITFSYARSKSFNPQPSNPLESLIFHLIISRSNDWISFVTSYGKTTQFQPFGDILNSMYLGSYFSSNNISSPLQWTKNLIRSPNILYIGGPQGLRFPGSINGFSVSFDSYSGPLTPFYSLNSSCPFYFGPSIGPKAGFQRKWQSRFNSSSWSFPLSTLGSVNSVLDPHSILLPAAISSLFGSDVCVPGAFIPLSDWSTDINAVISAQEDTNLDRVAFFSSYHSPLKMSLTDSILTSLFVQYSGNCFNSSVMNNLDELFSVNDISWWNYQAGIGTMNAPVSSGLIPDCQRIPEITGSLNCLSNNAPIPLLYSRLGTGLSMCPTGSFGVFGNTVSISSYEFPPGNSFALFILNSTAQIVDSYLFDTIFTLELTYSFEIGSIFIQSLPPIIPPTSSSTVSDISGILNVTINNHTILQSFSSEIPNSVETQNSWINLAWEAAPSAWIRPQIDIFEKCVYCPTNISNWPRNSIFACKCPDSFYLNPITGTCAAGDIDSNQLPQPTTVHFSPNGGSNTIFPQQSIIFSPPNINTVFIQVIFGFRQKSQYTALIDLTTQELNLDWVDYDWPEQKITQTTLWITPVGPGTLFATSTRVFVGVSPRIQSPTILLPSFSSSRGPWILEFETHWANLYYSFNPSVMDQMDPSLWNLWSPEDVVILANQSTVYVKAAFPNLSESPIKSYTFSSTLSPLKITEPQWNFWRILGLQEICQNSGSYCLDLAIIGTFVIGLIGYAFKRLDFIARESERNQRYMAIMDEGLEILENQQLEPERVSGGNSN